ncbi:MAG TPA: FGGY family carbohydrate kinase, partial [Herpetosiphonaceae bacterium]|nr:FGGY family carbohydrate kinase [Herpetosiphonaceae bacterium]
MKYILALDQGTTSTRCIVFDHAGAIVGVDQREHQQIFPRPGWVEHDAAEIWVNVQTVLREALERAGLAAGDLAAI